jgi:hypothetical protein
MIYSIVGTHKETREKGNKELAALGAISRYIYSEQVGELKSHTDATSLFGETLIITCVQLGDLASSKEVLVTLLPTLEASKNIFIIDEPFADIHLINKLHKVSKKLFNAKEEKIKDTSVFALCDSFASRDKKQAWVDFMHLRNKTEGEAIQGALWWKFQSVWQTAKAGRRSPYTLPECERIGGDLVRSTIMAHRGEIDLMTELERIILSL